jgi:hypothetical protein
MNNAIPTQPVYLNPAHTNFTSGVTELNHPYFPKFIVVLIVLTIVLLSFMTVTALGEVITRFQLDRALGSEGIAHQGEIVDCRPKLASRRPIISVTYAYVIERQRYIQLAQLSDETCALYPVGSTIDLHYVRSSPASARLDEEPSGVGILPAVFTMVVTTLLALGLALVIRWNFIQQTRLNALRTHGQVLDGELILIEEKAYRSTRGRRHPYLVVRYRLVSPGGESLEGKMQTFERHLIARQNLFSPGTPVKVLYANDGAFVML